MTSRPCELWLSQNARDAAIRLRPAATTNSRQAPLGDKIEGSASLSGITATALQLRIIVCLIF